jgi:hypothetical protein
VEGCEVRAQNEGRPKLRWAHECKGLVLRAPNGLVYVPFEMRQGSYSAVTLYDPAGVYPPNGYNIIVFNEDLERDEVAWDPELVPERAGDREPQTVGMP